MTLRRVGRGRHGQTDYNAAGIMQGQLDSVLTADGIAQATAVAPMMAAFAPDLVISSDLRRAVDTAEFVGNACGLPVKVDPRLRETHLGEWQGKSVAEVERAYPGAIDRWRRDPTWAPPGGESRVAVAARARAVIDELDAEYAVSGVPGDPNDPESATALIVAHGGVIAGLVCTLLDLPHRVWPAIGGLGNCKWTVLARRRDDPAWRLAGHNVGLHN